MSFVMKVSGAAPGLRIENWICRDCNCVVERKRTPQEVEANEPFQCVNCDSMNTEHYVGTVTDPHLVVRGNHDYSERIRKQLYERSNAHFKKEGREEAIERQRAQFKREGLVQ